jgi:predicted DNA-binding transcriptional regulator AlpA
MNHSTAQVARKVGIGKQTLHRWIREGKVSAPRKQRVGGVVVRLWSGEDVDRVRKFKAANYCRGRGRKKKSKA